MKYYYEQSGASNGPFRKEELKGKISKETLIWYRDVENWVKASDVEDLDDLLTETSNPVPDNKPPKTAKPVPHIFRSVLKIKSEVKHLFFKLPNLLLRLSRHK